MSLLEVVREPREDEEAGFGQSDIIASQLVEFEADRFHVVRVALGPH